MLFCFLIQCMLSFFSFLFFSFSSENQKSVTKVLCVFANYKLMVVGIKEAHFTSSMPVPLTLPGNAYEELLFAKLVTGR